MPEALAYAFVQVFGTGGFVYASAAGPAILAYATVAAYATTFVAAAGYSRYAKRKAQTAVSANLQDRTVPIRSAEEARTIVYGQTRVSGVVVYGAVHGSDREKVTLVYALAGHPIDSFQEIWLGDKSVGVLDANGGVTEGSDWYASKVEGSITRFEAGGTGTSYDIAEPYPITGVYTIAFDAPYQATSDEPYTQQAVIVPQEHYTVNLAAKRITLLVNDYAGALLVVTYSAQRGSAKASFTTRLGNESDYDLRDIALENATVDDDAPWTSFHKGFGVPRIHVTHTWDETVYAQGLPPASAIVRGKRCYDPRFDSTYPGGVGAQRVANPATWAWSNNPAICTADYLMDDLGFGCDPSEIDWESVIDSANVCDTVDAGRVQFTCDGVLSTDTTRKANLETLLSAMAGSALWSAGKWYVRAAAYEAPAAGASFNEYDLADSNISVQTHIPRAELFNSVRGRFRDPAQLYAITDFPLYESGIYKAQDGGEAIYEDIELPMTQDAAMAQRLAKLVLNRTRQAVTITATFKLSVYALQPGDTLTLSLARYGWSNKVFRVLDREFIDLFTVRLVLQEEAQAVYAFDYDIDVTQYDPAPNTNLPDPRYVPAPSNVERVVSALSFYTQADGTVVPYVDLKWDAPPSDVSVEVYWKRPTEMIWQRIVRPAGDDRARIEGVSGGEWLSIYIVNVNPLGARSAIYWIPTFQLPSELPKNGQLAGAVSANLLSNATFEYSTDKWSTPLTTSGTGVFIQEPSYPIRGVPSNARMGITSPATGQQYAWVDSDYVPVERSTRHIAYCGLIPWACDGYVELHWYSQIPPVGAPDPNIYEVSRLWGNYVLGKASDAVSDWRPDRLDDYQISRVDGIAPEGARYAKIRLVAFNWTAPDTWQGHYLFCAAPFLGRIPLGVTERPPWDPGGSPMIGSGGIIVGAVTNTATITSVPDRALPQNAGATPHITTTPRNADAGDIVTWTITGSITVNSGIARFGIKPTLFTDALGQPKRDNEWRALGVGQDQAFALQGTFTIPPAPSKVVPSLSFYASVSAGGSATLHTAQIVMTTLKR